MPIMEHQLLVWNGLQERKPFHFRQGQIQLLFQSGRSQARSGPGSDGSLWRPAPTPGFGQISLPLRSGGLLLLPYLLGVPCGTEKQQKGTKVS